MRSLLLAAVVALIHSSHAALMIKGPTEPVLEGDMVTLECLNTDGDLNISRVHFEFFSEYMQGWNQVWWRSVRSYCFYDRAVEVEEDGEKAYLRLFYPTRFSGVPVRCVSDAGNATEPEYVSDSITFKVHYLRGPSLTMEGYSRYMEVPQDVKVRVGADVVVKCSASSSEEPSYFWQKEGSDWVLPSPLLKVTKASALDEGKYTCLAKNPSVESLNVQRTISITVLPKDAPWYKTTNGSLWLMTSCAALVLLACVLCVSVLLCRRAKKIKTSKGPIDDHSQKKPIYRTSVESIPSTCMDKQPLV
uniref:Si:ch211-79k12.1 n=1 Tax=Oryzias latipes TaxID=8090 RepID=A0A3P9MMB9_ORYLA